MTAVRPPAASSDCPSGKIAYVQRKDAHQACLRAKRNGQHVRPYRCIHGCPHWHIGHLSSAVISGEYSADDWYGGGVA